MSPLYQAGAAVLQELERLPVRLPELLEAVERRAAMLLQAEPPAAETTGLLAQDARILELARRRLGDLQLRLSFLPAPNRVARYVDLTT